MLLLVLPAAIGDTFAGARGYANRRPADRAILPSLRRRLWLGGGRRGARESRLQRMMREMVLRVLGFAALGAKKTQAP